MKVSTFKYLIAFALTGLMLSLVMLVVYALHGGNVPIVTWFTIALVTALVVVYARGVFRQSSTVNW